MIGETAEQPKDAAWDTYLYAHLLGAGIAAGQLISPEIIKALNESQDALNLDDNNTNRDDKPPKPPRPPRKPNARIGQPAFGHG